MSLADKLSTPPATDKGPSCSISLILEHMTAEDVAAFDRAMADKRFTAVAITLALQSEGFAVKEQAVRRHRLGRCKCGDLA